jgi:hypothetical protein
MKVQIFSLPLFSILLYSIEENLHLIAQTFNVNIFVSMFSVSFIFRLVFSSQPGYQNPTKHSFKIFGTESNGRKCLIEIINRMFKHSNRSPVQGDNESNNQQTPTVNIEKVQETEVSTSKFQKFKSFIFRKLSFKTMKNLMINLLLIQQQYL